MSDLIEISESNFKQEVLESLLSVVVEFGADWCRPCKVLEPILRQLALEWSGKVIVAHINIDHAQNLVRSLTIFSVPTTILFSKGKAVERLVGLQTKEKLREKLGNYL